MKAVVLEKLGGPEVLRVKEVPNPEITDENELLIDMKFSGLNFAEILSRRGLYQWVPQKKGYILGMEGSGIVVETGNNVKGEFKVGDRVIVARGFGCHAEYVKIDQKYVFPAIKSFNFEQNASFTGSFLTAYIALKEMARVRNGESILIQAAAGALGTAAVQLSKSMGLVTLGTASQDHKIEFLERELNIDYAINYETENFRHRVMEWTKNKGVDVVLESVGGNVFRESLLCLSPMGRLILVGLSSVNFSKWNPLTWWSAFRTFPRVNLLNMLGRSQGVLAFHAGRLLDSDYDRIRKLVLDLIEVVENHKIYPIIDKIFPLENIADAHKRISSRQNVGKVVLKLT